METAKRTDLPDLLEHLGYTVRRLGSRYHTTREMDSLRIKDRRTWKRYSNGTGGDAITFLQEFCGKDFREAVNYLLEFNGKRGTYDLNGSGFKADAVGSDKSVAFRLPCDPALDWVAVFEAPIDLMSFCTLHQAVTSNAVALCGLYQGPLDTYLRENPHLKRIVLCLDADAPGREAAERFRAEYGKKGYDVSTRTPAQGKDWNAYLQQRGQARERGDQRKTIAR